MTKLNSNLERRYLMLTFLVLLVTTPLIGMFASSAFAQEGNKEWTDIYFEGPPEYDPDMDGVYNFSTLDLDVGDTFNATVKVKNVTGMYAWQVTCWVNRTVLNITAACIHPDEPLHKGPHIPGGPMFGIGRGQGSAPTNASYVKIGATGLPPAKPFNGSAPLTILEFEVMSAPPEGGELSSVLNFNGVYEIDEGEYVGTGDGTTTKFSLDHKPVVSGSETIYLDGNETTAYTINYTTGKITFDTAPETGVRITATYTAINYVTYLLLEDGETEIECTRINGWYGYYDFGVQTKTHEIIWEETSYYVVTESNVSISQVQFNYSGKSLSFNATAMSGLTGYVNVTILKTFLWDDPWKIYINEVQLDATDFTETENDTHAFLYFTWPHESTVQVTIVGTGVVPEFPTYLLLPLLMTLTAIAVAKGRIVRRKNQAK